jgi:hypothetical protein
LRCEGVKKIESFGIGTQKTFMRLACPPPGVPGIPPPPPPPGAESKKKAVSPDEIRKLKLQQTEELGRLQKAVLFIASQDSELFDKATGVAEREALGTVLAVNASLRRKLEEKNVKLQALVEISDENLNIDEAKYEISDENIFKDILTYMDRKLVVKELNKEEVIVRNKIVESPQVKAFYETLILIANGRLSELVANEGNEDARTILIIKRFTNIDNIKSSLFNNDRNVDELSTNIGKNSYVHFLQEELRPTLNAKLFSGTPRFEKIKWSKEHYYREGDTPEQKATIETLSKRISATSKYKGDMDICLYRPNDISVNDWIAFLTSVSRSSLSDDQRALKANIDSIIDKSTKIQQRWGSGFLPYLHRSDSNMTDWNSKMQELIDFANQKDKEHNLDVLSAELSNIKVQIENLKNEIRQIPESDIDRKNDLNKALRQLLQRLIRTQNQLSSAKTKAAAEIPEELKTWQKIERQTVNLAAKPTKFGPQKGRFGFYVGNCQNGLSDNNWLIKINEWSTKSLASPPPELASKIDEINREQKLQSDINDAIKEIVQKFSSNPKYPIDILPYKGKLSEEDWFKLLNLWKGADQASPPNEIKEAQFVAHDKQEYDQARSPIDKVEDEEAENQQKSGGAPSQTVFGVRSKKQLLKSIRIKIQEHDLKNLSYSDIMNFRQKVIDEKLAEVQRNERDQGQEVTINFSNSENLSLWLETLRKIEIAVVDGNIAEKFPELNEKINGAPAHSPTFEFTDISDDSFDAKLKSYASTYAPLKSYLTNANTQTIDVSANITRALNDAIKPAMSALNASLTENLNAQIQQLILTRQENINLRFNVSHNDQAILNEASVKSKDDAINVQIAQYTADKAVLSTLLTDDLSSLDRNALLQKLSDIENLSNKLIDQRTKIDQGVNGLIKEIDRLIKIKQNEANALVTKISDCLLKTDSSRVSPEELKQLLGLDIDHPTSTVIDKLNSYLPGGSNDIVVQLPPELSALSFKVDTVTAFNNLRTHFNFDRMDSNISDNFEEMFLRDQNLTENNRMLVLQYIHKNIYDGSPSRKVDFHDAKAKGYHNKEEYAAALYDTLIESVDGKRKLKESSVDRFTLPNRNPYFRSLGSDGYDTKYSNKFPN